MMSSKGKMGKLKFLLLSLSLFQLGWGCDVTNRDSAYRSLIQDQKMLMEYREKGDIRRQIGILKDILICGDFLKIDVSYYRKELARLQKQMEEGKGKSRGKAPIVKGEEKLHSSPVNPQIITETRYPIDKVVKFKNGKKIVIPGMLGGEVVATPPKIQEAPSPKSGKVTSSSPKGSLSQRGSQKRVSPQPPKVVKSKQITSPLPAQNWKKAPSTKVSPIKSYGGNGKFAGVYISQEGVELTFPRPVKVNHFTIKGQKYKEVFDVKGGIIARPHFKTLSNGKRVKIAQFQKNTLRLVIEGKSPFQLTYSLINGGKKLIIKFSSPPHQKKNSGSNASPTPKIGASLPPISHFLGKKKPTGGNSQLKTVSLSKGKKKLFSPQIKNLSSTLSSQKVVKKIQKGEKSKIAHLNNGSKRDSSPPKNISKKKTKVKETRKIVKKLNKKGNKGKKVASSHRKNGVGIGKKGVDPFAFTSKRGSLSQKNSKGKIIKGNISPSEAAFLGALPKSDWIGGPPKIYQKVIVIDPGHGGRDPGGIGYRHLKEKRVVLGIARKLAHILRKRGYRVYLTRSRDKFVPLKERTRFANDKHANLFVSIHGNIAYHHDKRLRGIEIYYLSKAQNKRALDVAMEENKGVQGLNLAEQKVILNFLNKERMVESHKLGIDVRRNLSARLKKRYPIGRIRVRGGPFWVLVGTQMPSILIETGYLTNPTDARLLKDSKFQWNFATGIANGIDAYFRKNR